MHSTRQSDAHTQQDQLPAPTVTLPTSLPQSGPIKQAALLAAAVGLRLTLAFRSAAQAATQVLRSWHLLPNSSPSAQPTAHSIPTAALQPQQLQQPTTDAQSPPSSSQAPGGKAAAAVSATWSALQQKAADSGFIKMLHSLDKPTITLEAKWPELQRHLAGHAELGQKLQSLFAASSESSRAVAATLAQTGGTLQPSFWNSKQCQELISQEEDLKSCIFAQMLQAT